MLASRKFGTAPVFFTAISTILGAVLFLRFGYGVGTLGFWGMVFIILLGHAVTIPTALAISEIATNKRVEGGGEYFIISRSFGLNIGATIGIALFLSQAISVAFYVIAFTEAFEFFFEWISRRYDILLPRQVISIPVMLALSFLVIKKGANLGVKILYGIVAMLGISLLLFFIGKTPEAAASGFNLANAEMRNTFQFFTVFAIIFPAFTGMTAGVGLSGDLKNPGKSIPRGTTTATLIGAVIYFFVCYKLALSASPEDLIGNQLIMSKIAFGGKIIIPLGLAASTISSAIGSVMVAPRTLQALASDDSFPLAKTNKWLSAGRANDNEPINASALTCIIAFIFVAVGNVNSVASIITMFFLVVYGSLCLISFLNHFGTSPSYRPSFRSRWYFSLIGFLFSIWIMFKISMPYATIAILLMIAVHIYLNYHHKERKGLEAIFANAIFQINRGLQIFLQKESSKKEFVEWRPSAICISKDTFERDTALRFLNWISYKYGFGTYLHRIDGYYSKKTYHESKVMLQKLIKISDQIGNYVYIDTFITPSYTTAIAQAIQIHGISGMENNMVIFEFDKENPEELPQIIDNYNLVNAGNFDVLVLAASRKPIYYHNGIHVWIKASDSDNANLMILLSFIILGNPEWKNGTIKIFSLCKEEEYQETRQSLQELIATGRLPITTQNIQIIIQKEDISVKSLINSTSTDAGLTILGFKDESLKHHKEELFSGYDDLGTVVFVNSNTKKVIV